MLWGWGSGAQFVEGEAGLVQKQENQSHGWSPPLLLEPSGAGGDSQ